MSSSQGGGGTADAPADRDGDLAPDIDPGLAPGLDPGLAWMAGGGQAGALIRSIDWSRTPVGPVARATAPMR